MKFSLILAAVLAMGSFSCLAAQAGPACTAKRVEIESQLSEAKVRGIPHEVAGLQRALRASKANCTDESLAKRRDVQIQKAQREVSKRDNELASAERAGNAKKIEKRRAKADEARRELADAEKPLTKSLVPVRDSALK